MRARDEQGFSLVELTTTVAVIAIIAAIAIPSMMGAMPRLRLDNRATTLANEIASTRMQAIAKSNEFRFVFSPGSDSYRMEKLVGASWLPYSTNTLGDTNLVSTAGFDTANTLVIEPTGAASVPLGSQGVILLQTAQGDHQRQLLVEATGRVIVQKRQAGGAWATQ